MKKRILTMIAAAVMTLTMSITAFAHTGVWQQDGTGWWWQRQNGNYPTNQWVWIDGNADNIVECYYFGPDGYMLANTTTPDGYTVDANGAWTVNGVVQSRAMQPLTDDNYIPGQDTSGAVTDPNATAQITVNEEIWNAITENRNFASMPFTQTTVGEAASSLATYYYTQYNNTNLKVRVRNSDNGVISFFGAAKLFLNNIPTQGIEVKAFFTNSKLIDPWGGINGHVLGSTGDLDRTFGVPASSLRVLQANYGDSVRNLWIQLTQGSDGNWYVYPDSPAFMN